jgi:hypothetical protein
MSDLFSFGDEDEDEGMPAVQAPAKSGKRLAPSGSVLSASPAQKKKKTKYEDELSLPPPVLQSDHSDQNSSVPEPMAIDSTPPITQPTTPSRPTPSPAVSKAVASPAPAAISEAKSAPTPTKAEAAQMSAASPVKNESPVKTKLPLPPAPTADWMTSAVEPEGTRSLSLSLSQ